MKLTLPSLVCALLLSSSFCSTANASGPCYTVYGKKDVVVYRSEEPPIDLSHSISSGIDKRFPGGHLVVQSGVSDCPRVLPAGTQANSFGVGPDDSPALRLKTPLSEVQAQRKRRGSSAGTTRTATAAPPLTAPTEQTFAAPAPSALPESALGTFADAGPAGRGGSVHVSAYQRRDGQVVAAHTRAAGGRGGR